VFSVQTRMPTSLSCKDVCLKWSFFFLFFLVNGSLMVVTVRCGYDMDLAVR
jgi:hypothetical protein